MRKTILNRMILAALSSALAQSAFAVYPTGSGTNYVTNYGSYYYGQTGTVTFNDWGYVGPNGSGVNDFVVPGSGGFDASQVGQIQKVVTYGANSTGVSNLDGLTPDKTRTVIAEDGSAAYYNANMDGQVNFYRWGYTTPAGSTFNNMQIDKNGNYFVARNDMAFGFYDYFTSSWSDTSTGTVHPGTVDTGINFQPYAVSDARGWCGSVLNTDPNGVAKMAGQVTFDFAFDAYLNDGTPTAGQGGGTQIVPGFVMRSYGDYNVTVSAPQSFDPNFQTVFKGNAVMNNTNPLTGALDPAYQNKVSFLGGGVVPKGVWVTANSYNPDGSRKLNADSTWQLTIAPGFNLCVPGTDPAVRASDGAHCWQNSFAGYGFLLRADGSRTLEFINPTGHSNYVATDPAAYASIATVPVPAAVWLFGSGLMGLIGLGRGRRHV